MIATVDTGALLELVWAAPVAALAVTLAMGLVVHGTTRAYEAGREGRTLIAVVHASIAGAGALLFLGAVVVGLLIMTAKG